MNDTPEHLEATIAALEAQRALLGNAVVDSALAPLRRELASMRSVEVVPLQQLKQVSVLFVDVVGSTAIGERLQPEDIQAVMDGALERFSAVVQAHRGRVLQYTGDGMLAAFGADESREDDAECAVLAALGILEEAKHQAAAAFAAHAISDFDVRTGINTGTVLLGGGMDAEGSIRGAVVNVAARMEQSAPTGALRISHATYRHVHGLFEVEEQAPIKVKGVEAPMRNYLVQRPRPSGLRAALRGIDGVQTRLVGRDRELAALRAAFDAADAERALRVVAIVGDAGLGKSRLIDEFRRMLETGRVESAVLPARSHPRSALQPYGLLRDLVSRHLQIADSDSAEIARTRLVDGMTPHFTSEGEAPAHWLGHLIGFDFADSRHVAPMLTDAAQIRERAVHALALYLRRLAGHRGAPVVVILDDLHWTDPGSLDAIRGLLQANEDLPALFLLLTRPELLDRESHWGAGAASWHTRLDLAPLDKASSEQLAGSLLQRLDGVPGDLCALITAGAEGNPFYMEELVKLLVDDGAIAVDAAGRWQLQPDRLLRVRVPPTLTGVLQVRLDALRPSEKAALQHAAVIGHVFSDQSLAAVDAGATAALPALLRRQLIIKRDGAAIDGPHEYAFQHNLLYQVTYDGVLKETKRSGHAKAGAYWSVRAEVATPQQVTPASRRALVEAHYHRCLVEPAAYASWFDSQFNNYLKAYATETLRPLAEALVDVCGVQFGVEHPHTAKALTNLARGLLQLGDTAKAEPLLHRAIAIQEGDPGPEHPDTARTVAVLGGIFMNRGNHATAEPLFRRALAIREGALGVEHPLTVAALDLLAMTVGELARYGEAEELSRRVLEIRERLLGPEHPDTCLAMTALGDVLSKRKDHAAAEPLIRRALAAQQKNLPPEHPDTGLTMWNLAEALHGLGRYSDAEALARDSLRMWEKTLGPQHEWTAWSLSSLAKLRLAQQDAGDAAQLARRAIDIHERQLGADHPTVAENLQILGRALVGCGNLVEAEPLFARALAIQCDKLGVDDPATCATRALIERTSQLRSMPSTRGTRGKHARTKPPESGVTRSSRR